MEQRTDGRNLSDLRTFTEALHRAYCASGRSMESVADDCGLKRGYLSDALNTNRQEVLQFPARKLEAFCKATTPLPLEWLADKLGFVLVPREHAQTSRDLLLETLDASAAAGRLSERVSSASKDGVIDSHERADIVELARRGQREFAEVERAVEALPVQIVRRA
jgi:hypothetical protein